MRKNMNLNELRNIIRNIIKEVEENNDEWKIATRDDALNYISDLHKSVYGHRPSRDMFFDFSNEELGQEIENLEKLAKEEEEREINWELESIDDFEKLIQKTIDSGAKNRETAVRWLYDAEDYYDISHFLYKYDIRGYTEKGFELKKEIEKILN